MSSSPQDFAREWVEAWNSHDLARILSHYEEDVTLISPRAKLVLGVADGAVRGKAALGDYLRAALVKVPDLKFTLDRVFAGVDSVVIEFHTNDGRHGAEFMDFGINGKVARVLAHYAAA
jgi:ketosteroid isomerase-like protein